MVKKRPLRTLMDSQHVKVSERLLQSAPQFFSHIYWSLWKEISSEYSVSVVSEILRLLVNILIPDERYSLSVKASVNAINSNGVISKSKNVFLVFFCIIGIYIKFGVLWKKRWASEMISFWNNRLQKPGLLKCLKSPVSEHLWTVNMLKCPKVYLNFHGTIFVTYFDHSERKSARKVLF